MEWYTAQFHLSMLIVQIQGHLSNENCLLLNPLKWVLSVEQCGLWLNGCLTKLP